MQRAANVTSIMEVTFAARCMLRFIFEMNRLKCNAIMKCRIGNCNSLLVVMLYLVKFNLNLWLNVEKMKWCADTVQKLCNS